MTQNIERFVKVGKYSYNVIYISITRVNSLAIIINVIHEEQNFRNKN